MILKALNPKFHLQSNQNLSSNFQKLDNVQVILDYLDKNGSVKLVNMGNFAFIPTITYILLSKKGAESIVSKKVKFILSLIWIIILNYKVKINNRYPKRSENISSTFISDEDHCKDALSLDGVQDLAYLGLMNLKKKIFCSNEKILTESGKITPDVVENVLSLFEELFGIDQLMDVNDFFEETCSSRVYQLYKSQFDNIFCENFDHFFIIKFIEKYDKFEKRKFKYQVSVNKALEKHIRKNCKSFDTILL